MFVGKLTDLILQINDVTVEETTTTPTAKKSYKPKFVIKSDEGAQHSSTAFFPALNENLVELWMKKSAKEKVSKKSNAKKMAKKCWEILRHSLFCKLKVEITSNDKLPKVFPKFQKKYSTKIESLLEKSPAFAETTDIDIAVKKMKLALDFEDPTEYLIEIEKE